MKRGDTIEPCDRAWQSACPTVAAPCVGPLPDMKNGQRVIVAANGVFLHVKLDWLDCILRLADMASVPPLPYGAVQERTRFSFGVIPVRLLQEFIAAGRAGLPNEIAGGLIYSRRSGKLRLQIYEALHLAPGSSDERKPVLEEDESIAVDLHTHGYRRAYFTAADYRDNLGIKVAGVFGNLDRERPSAAFRLAINGYLRALRHPWEAPYDRTRALSDTEDSLDAEIPRSAIK